MDGRFLFEDLHRRSSDKMMFALNKMLRPAAKETAETETTDGSSNEEIEVKIHPKLKILAEEIIRDNKGEK